MEGMGIQRGYLRMKRRNKWRGGLPVSAIGHEIKFIRPHHTPIHYTVVEHGTALHCAKMHHTTLHNTT
jgi:hypothetical protein